MRKIVLIVFLVGLSKYKGQAQNKQILYGFDEIPQTLLLNPGENTNYKYHIGIPFLSGISTNLGTTGFTVADLFRNNSIDFNAKVASVLDKVSTNDFIYLNSQVEILNGGFKFDDKTYLSFGFYTEVDVFGHVPRDAAKLVIEGNGANLNKTFSASQIILKADALSVLHAGASRKLNDKLTVGTRLKIYSGILNMQTSGNTGTFSTTLSDNSIYTNYLEDINVNTYTSGFVNDKNEAEIDGSNLVSNAFLGGNLGLGLDIGFSYQLSPQLEITASLLDIGFISYSKNIKNTVTKGNYTFSGIEFEYDPINVTDYWNNLKNDFEEKVPSVENKESYTVSRPIKFNSSIRYSWGKSRNEENCSDMSYKDYYENAVGGQLYSVFRPLGPQLALTGFYERVFDKLFRAKITYTVDDYSSSNIGVGISSNLGMVNIYGMVDNIIGISDIADSNYTSFQFGVNLILD